MSWLTHLLGRFAPWLSNPDVVEIAINPDRRVWLLKRGDLHMQDTGEMVEPGFGRKLSDQIAGQSHTHTGRDNLLVSASVEYEGRPVRVQSVLAPATTHEAAVSFRLFAVLPLREIEVTYLYGEPVSLQEKRLKRNEKLAELAASGDLMQALRFCVDEKLNLLVSGGTDTGKSVLLRKVISLIPQDERIITIEDAQELYPEQPNVVSLIATRKGTVRTSDLLLEATLRMRPDRLILGEVRGDEAMTFIEAINTGHGGSMTTIHAETPQLAMVKLAKLAGRNAALMSYADLRSYISQTIDVIIQTGRVGGKRGVAEFFIPTSEDNIQ